MTQFADIPIGFETRSFLLAQLPKCCDFTAANVLLREICGIHAFFQNEEELTALLYFLSNKNPLVQETDRAEYGDFQTNVPLTKKIVDELAARGVMPQVVIEPTFGKGNFILAALQTFPNLEIIIGVEIYKPYFWETQFGILAYFLQNPVRPAPAIRLFHQDVFLFDFQTLSREFSKKKILVLGNPPWVTNAKLGTLNSTNLPTKSNFKNLDGFDAMTGKGNFDIGEFITIMLLRAFHRTEGWMAFLVKNAVIRNIVLEQPKARFHLGQLTQTSIDAKKEFGAAVEAALFFCQFNAGPEEQCVESETRERFGWVDNRFVSNVRQYATFQWFDGTSPFEWRQGLKHDCSAVMELESDGEHFRDASGGAVRLEKDLVYGLLKSSDLKGGVIAEARKFTIVTQRKIGQDTAWIEQLLPQTFHYLQANRTQFNNRKSSIYKNKPAFSIFGIGDYSFLPYKVAISGLYKSATFTLVLPQDGKPIMLDDTCYFLGFEKLADAVIVFALLNHPLAQGFLDTITFSDAKRKYTKDVLMRLDLAALATAVDSSEIESVCTSFTKLQLPSEEDFTDFLTKLNPAAIPSQLQLF